MWYRYVVFHGKEWSKNLVFVRYRFKVEIRRRVAQKLPRKKCWSTKILQKSEKWCWIALLSSSKISNNLLFIRRLYKTRLRQMQFSLWISHSLLLEPFDSILALNTLWGVDWLLSVICLCCLLACCFLHDFPNDSIFFKELKYLN